MKWSVFFVKLPKTFLRSTDFAHKSNVEFILALVRIVYMWVDLVNKKVAPDAVVRCGSSRTCEAFFESTWFIVSYWERATPTEGTLLFRESRCPVEAYAPQTPAREAVTKANNVIQRANLHTNDSSGFFIGVKLWNSNDVYDVSW